MRPILKFIDLAFNLCKQEMEDRFAGSILGSCWVFIWPLVQLFIYIVVFGRIMGARLGMNDQIYSYGIYVASGLVCWTCFANTLQRVTRTFLDKRNIILKVQVDLRLFPAAICMGELMPFAAGIALLSVADIANGWLPRPSLILLALLALYCQQLLACGLGLIFACATVFARDMAEAVAVALQMGFWFTPVVYLPSILPQWLEDILWINPMTEVVMLFQQCFVFQNSPQWWPVVYMLVTSHLAMGFGLFILNHWQKEIRDAI